VHPATFLRGQGHERGFESNDVVIVLGLIRVWVQSVATSAHQIEAEFILGRCLDNDPAVDAKIATAVPTKVELPAATRGPELAGDH
jgi:hypothetical protein